MLEEDRKRKAPPDIFDSDSWQLNKNWGEAPSLLQSHSIPVVHHQTRQVTLGNARFEACSKWWCMSLLYSPHITEAYRLVLIQLWVMNNVSDGQLCVLAGFLKGAGSSEYIGVESQCRRYNSTWILIPAVNSSSVTGVAAGRLIYIHSNE